MTTENVDSIWIESKELRIKVPWGYVATKTWGDDRYPIALCFHGVMDNASSFDRLMEYLPKTYFYVCVDLPGHGRSSHFPPNLPIHSINYILVYIILAQFFKRNEYTIIGHSYGGQLGFIFAQMYPEYVEKLVLFDTITLLPVSSKQYGDYLVDKFETFLHAQEKLTRGNQPTYTYDEAFKRLVTGRNHAPLTEPAAKALIERAIEPTGDGRFRFTLDQRLKYFMNPLRDFRYIIQTCKTYPIKCPVLIILGKESTTQQIYMRPVIFTLNKFKNISIKYVAGHHDVHNTHPERVAPLVLEFLAKKKGKL